MTNNKTEMNLDKMKRAIIIGCPGSGKSTFAKKLCNSTDLPLYHLDNLFWNADKTTVEKSVFLQRLNEVLTKEKWIIDGNYNSTMEMRIKACDTVFFLDYPVDVCIKGIEERKGKARSDIPWVETETDAEFMDFVQKFNIESRPKILEILEKYTDKNIYVFQSRAEADAYLGV